MGERRGTKALELWCRRITEGYPGVKVDNMTTSWRDGLAFCAMIHHFRPDLIEFEKLNKSNVYYNNDLAFRTAEAHLGIPALLDADDMATYEVPDRLSILTYLSQFYQVFAAQGKRNIGLICSTNYDSTNRLKRTSTSAEKSSITKTPGPPPKMAHIVGVPKREPCKKCSLPVFLAERVIVGKYIYHRTCLKCARCKSQLSLGSFYETEIDGEFCCETCPDEESNDSPTAESSLDSSRSKGATGIDENESPNKTIGMRSSIADRLAFFEKTGQDGTHLLQKSVSDEEKRKSLKKIAAQYKPNAALASFMNTTLNDEVNNDQDDISFDDNSKYDTTIESSDDEHDANLTEEDKPPELPKNGPPIDDDLDDTVLSVTIESHSKPPQFNPIKSEKEQIINDNAPKYISNSNILLTSPTKLLLTSPIKEETNHNHSHITNYTININNNNDVNLSSNVTKDISNIQNDDLQMGTTMNTKPDDLKNIESPQNSEEIINVELRNERQRSLADSPKNDSTLNKVETETISDIRKIDPTEQRLSVVRARLQQFEEVLKTEEDINNSRKSTISISSSKKLNRIENSKLDNKSIISNIVEEKNQNEIVNLTGNEVPNNDDTIKKITETIICKNESESDFKEEEEPERKFQDMEVDISNDEPILSNVSSQQIEEVQELESTKDNIKEESNEIVSDEMDTVEVNDEINIKEQIKLSEDDKQIAVINVSKKSIINAEENLQKDPEIISSQNETKNCDPVENDPTSQTSANTESDKTNIPISSEVIFNENKKSDSIDTMTLEMQVDETKVVTLKTNKTIPLESDKISLSRDNNNSKKPALIHDDIDYPDELNPFASDDDDDNCNNVDNKIEKNNNNVVRRNDKKANESTNNSTKALDRRKSLNPFDSSDDEIEYLEQQNQKQDIKVKPPRPPPPKISKNPFGSDTDGEDEDQTGSGNTSLVSMGSIKRTPVPTPRVQLTLSAKKNLTPEPTPRTNRQTYNARSRLENSNEYYGSNISLSSSITSPTGKDSFYRQNETRSSNNSLASSTGGNSGLNSLRSRKKKAAPPPPVLAGTGTPISKTSKELFPPNVNEYESRRSTPASSTATTPQMSRKKRPAPKPPTGLPVSPKVNEVKKSSENVPELISETIEITEPETSTDLKNDSSVTNAEAIDKVEIAKLSDEEKVAHLDGRQFFLEATSTSSKVSEIHKEENIKSLNDTSITSEQIPSKIDSSNDILEKKTGDVESSNQAISEKSLTDSENLILKNNKETNTESDENQSDYSCVKQPDSIDDPKNINDIDYTINEMQHDRHIEKIKDNKESKNRNRQSQNYSDDTQNDLILNKSIHGKWKRRKGPAPSLPVPPRKIIQMLPLQEIRHELQIIEVQQQGLEKQGVILETMIRERCEGKNGELINAAGNLDEKIPNSKEVEDLILQLFDLVNEKNELFRRQAELMYLRRQHRLEQEQADLEYEIRVLMAQPERNKTDSDKSREEVLIARLVEVVQLRNEVIECLEMDRLREAEEDLSIKQSLELHTAKRDEEMCKQTPTKLSKKEKKKQKELKKSGKSKKIDADKDADESEINVPTQKKKSKRKFLFSVLTSKADQK